MNRSVKFKLNKFPITPYTLRTDSEKDMAASECGCDLARLYHHYYLDTYGKQPPNPDPANFEQIQHLHNCDDFRFAGDGIGASTAARRAISTAMGQAFCRWFLHDHLNITYFAHMDKVINKNLPTNFGHLKIVRTNKGDVPDYVCAESTDKIFIAEAKGRYTPIGFANKEFQDWRDQFDRVELQDERGNPISVKGFIVGTRFATESKPSIFTEIYAEDPFTRGDAEAGRTQAREVGLSVVAQHYVSILEKLNQPLVAAALANGTTIPEQLKIRATVWEIALDIPGMVKKFVGGYWPYSKGDHPFSFENNSITFRPSDPFRLDIGWGTFFGLEETVFRRICLMARHGRSLATEVVPIEDIPPFYSAISLLRDGSILGPLDFFMPVGYIDV
jgi:hypothetical protein